MKFPFLIIGAIGSILCLIGILSPKTGFWMGHGWQFRNVEPSVFVLVAIRIGSIFGFIGFLLIVMLSLSGKIH
jgi:hypothetical protein